MPSFNFFNLIFGNNTIHGTDRNDLIIGTFGDDNITAKDGDDLVFGLFGNDKIAGDLGDDMLFGGFGDDTVEGGDGDDYVSGGFGNDRVVGNKGDDEMFGGRGDDLLVWNNGDGSDLMDGGKGYDIQQVNFDTDLVNDDLQNDDVAEFSVTDEGIQFARIEVNGQTERGLFQLDIRNTEVQETNFGGGEDKAVITGDVLNEIKLDLDGGDGVDTLDLSQAAEAVKVNLKKGTLNDSHAENFENVVGTIFDDKIRGDKQDNILSGNDGDDKLFGKGGDDTIIGNKGNDEMFGGRGDDLLVWNNGDGSDLMDGGKGYDIQQVNFDTDLVNDDLQNDDVAEFSVTDEGIQFARIEVNGQTERGLFQLDIRNTEVQETNFGGGEDKAVITGDVLNEIKLDLDGGDGVDTLDFSQASGPISVNLETGAIEIDNRAGQDASAVNFENVTGTDSNDVIIGNDQDNVIRGGAGDDIMAGGEGADTFVFFEEDIGVDVILDFEVGVDQLAFLTTDPNVTTENLLANLSQVGDDVELALNNKVITFEDTLVTDFGADDFMIA
ncbi:calcium-binding protein [Roseobacter sp. MH60115]|uniref:calcium-binding protein n=1 Tax=Roseobacter sp. MH60115 TaxID=2785324 RepID=UPI0018A2CACA|nr:calcium-binding protein [Roseobacter sp. MH60115]